MSAFLTAVSPAPRTMSSTEKVLKKYQVNELIYKNHLGNLEIPISGTHDRVADPNINYLADTFHQVP